LPEEWAERTDRARTAGGGGGAAGAAAAAAAAQQQRQQRLQQQVGSPGDGPRTAELMQAHGQVRVCARVFVCRQSLPACQGRGGAGGCVILCDVDRPGSSMRWPN
jgi:hypothetical protein